MDMASVQLGVAQEVLTKNWIKLGMAMYCGHLPAVAFGSASTMEIREGKVGPMATGL